MTVPHPLPAVAVSSGAAVQVPPAVAGTEIATLPPLPPPTVAGHPVSRRTGEPSRPVLLGVACAMLYGGAAVAVVGLLKVLWDSATIAGFPTAARVFTWLPELRPVSFLAIVMVLLVALIGVVVAGAAGTVAYNAWNGQPWARVGGLVAVGVSLLTILLNPVAMIALAPIVIGAGVLWLPQLRSYTLAWAAIRQQVPVQPSFATSVHYGPLPRYT